MTAIHDASATLKLTQALDVSGVGTGPYMGARITLDGVAGTALVQVFYQYGVDASAVTQPIKDTPSATGTQTSVASSASAVTLLNANSNRLAATIYNDSTQILYLLLASPLMTINSTPSTTVYTTQVASNAQYELPANYWGMVQGIWASANGFARITEMT